jgi:DNA-binding NarL/FixJ family response regulator
MKITPRDREILERLRSGLSNRQIGKELDIAERTVKQHLRTLFLRFGIREGRKRIALLNLVYPMEVNETRLALLSTREREIVKLVIDGKTNAEIAGVGIGARSEQVIKNHLRSIFDKIGCDSRCELRYLMTA